MGVEPFHTAEGTAVWYPAAFHLRFQKRKVHSSVEELGKYCATVPAWLGSAQKSHFGPAPLEMARIYHLWDCSPKHPAANPGSKWV